MACGLCIAGWITYLYRKVHTELTWKDPDPYPYVFIGYAVIGVMKIVVTLFLTDRCEADYIPSQEEVADNADAHESVAPLLNGRATSYTKPKARPKTLRHRFTDPVTARVSTANRGILIRLCILFAINSFASGLLPVTLMSWYANWVRSMSTSPLRHDDNYLMSCSDIYGSYANL